MLTPLLGFGQQSGAFFRIIAPTNTKITAFNSQGYLVWTNAATSGVTCTVQRAATLAGPSNWVDYVQHRVTNATMTARVHDPNPPVGMVMIPSGSNSGTNPITEGEYYDPIQYPQTYSLTVSAFYMDAIEVTKAQWDAVYTWAVTNGYGFDNAGSGRASNHPVQMVNWYDCVKWCNARSQKEGRTPAYYRTSAKSTVYKTGQIDIENDCVNWGSGYRLPTVIEWEYAARGGASGRRLPWGDMIDHTRANYYGNPTSYAYDLGYEGYDTRYATGKNPYTSPAGAFAANGYGLFDMSGNVWEWCWDWYHPGYQGVFRVFSGGSWNDLAVCCRSSSRSYYYFPGYSDDSKGFRAVLPSGQQ